MCPLWKTIIGPLNWTIALAQHTVTHCNTLQRTATHCNTLQHNATHCHTLQHTAAHLTNTNHPPSRVWSAHSQHAAIHIVTRCNTYINTLQHHESFSPRRFMDVTWFVHKGDVIDLDVSRRSRRVTHISCDSAAHTLIYDSKMWRNSCVQVTWLRRHMCVNYSVTNVWIMMITFIITLGEIM